MDKFLAMGFSMFFAGIFFGSVLVISLNGVVGNSNNSAQLRSCQLKVEQLEKRTKRWRKKGGKRNEKKARRAPR